MKKTYIAPEIIVTELDGEVLMQSLSSGESLTGTTWGGQAGSNVDNGPKDADAQGRRGSWGNLWD